MGIVVDNRRSTRQKRYCRGSITTEASIVVPVVILGISAAIYLGMLLYQRAMVQSAAEMAAEAGASVWASGVCEISTGKPNPDSFEAIKLYRRLLDSSKEERLETIESYALDRAARNELLHPVESAAEAVMKDHVLCRKLEVTVTKWYRLPLGKYVKIFGGSGLVKLQVKASSSIDEPVELVRTTDFILDLEKKLEAANPEVKNLGDRARAAINDLKSKLEQFLK